MNGKRFYIRNIGAGRFLEIFTNRLENLTLPDWLELFSSFLSGPFILLGIFRLRYSRLQAYRAFERSVLVSFMLTQVFAFYREQFGALPGLMFNLSFYIILRFLTEREIETGQEKVSGGE